MMNSIYLYLLSPLHTGGATQEGNLLGIARESHTDLPYIPSSTIRGRLRASLANSIDSHDTNAKNQVRLQQMRLFGSELKDIQDKEFKEYYKEQTKRDLAQLEQGSIWIGDASILWLPVPSLSHGVVWISCPMLLRRWARLHQYSGSMPSEYSCNFHGNSSVYLKDAILQANDLQSWNGEWNVFLPQHDATATIERVLVLPDRHCSTLIQMSLWRQVKVKLDAHKSVEGGFRYEEAIPPDTLMYFSWGVVSQVNGKVTIAPDEEFRELLNDSSRSILQIGGQESLGRGFVQQWLGHSSNANGNQPSNN